MTRGTFYLINKTRAYQSLEFNGDMYPEGHGDDALVALRNVTTVKGFKETILRFNSEHHKYDLKEVNQYFGSVPMKVKNGSYKRQDGSVYRFREGLFNANGVIDFQDEFFPRFCSDWQFIKNNSGADIRYIDNDGEKGVIANGDTIRLDYGSKTQLLFQTIEEYFPIGTSVDVEATKYNGIEHDFLGTVHSTGDDLKVIDQEENVFDVNSDNLRKYVAFRGE